MNNIFFSIVSCLNIYCGNLKNTSQKVHKTTALAAVRCKAVFLLLLTCCLLLLSLWESIIVLCFVVRYFMSILVLQSP